MRHLWVQQDVSLGSCGSLVLCSGLSLCSVPLAELRLPVAIWGRTTILVSCLSQGDLRGGENRTGFASSLCPSSISSAERAVSHPSRRIPRSIVYSRFAGIIVSLAVLGLPLCLDDDFFVGFFFLSELSPFVVFASMLKHIGLPGKCKCVLEILQETS